ncbi:hypothetical protein HFO93_15620 [Rhizobium leguminosarum]|uniref:hypothetical protein n=1 Tax=Rhizobium TaxID=379 RepID=UPI00037D43FF|nr:MULTISPECIES: hypothetical protein [Rhizobium]MBY5444885.1 hypothetical protein [Rhizobium leguminosarum]NNG72260.1 hypothetical protein [Rhizobium laguerreae]
MRIQAALIFAMVAFSSSNVIGQTKEQPSAGSERCTASPADQNNQSAAEDAGKAAKDGSLSQKMDDCNGVLKPPPTGDSDFSKPAPEEGKTPVIRPDDLPGQQQPK